MLVELGCSVHHADNEGNTPWHSAAQSLSIEVLQKLLEYGCSVNEVNNPQCTALHYAARTGKHLPALNLWPVMDFTSHHIDYSGSPDANFHLVFGNCQWQILVSWP